MFNTTPLHTPEISRRHFLATSAGAAAFGLVGQAVAAKRHPKRGGTLHFATRGDISGLDPHRNLYYLVSNVIAATSQGLLDLNLQCDPVPGVAEEWSASPDLLTYTFKIRKGVLFHNGRDVDAEAVKWNFDRIKDPKTSHPFTRSALENLQETVAVDKYTLRCHLQEPSAAFPADVVYYPCNLMAPDSADQADTMPIGCGPFKLVRWERDTTTELVRFENYFETDAEGNALPYLDGMIGHPKKEDRVRLTSLRAGEVQLIDTMAYTDAAAFPKTYAGKFQTWAVPTLGISYVLFNMQNGAFADKRLRQAAAHAVDREAIKQAVFYGQGDTASGCYGPASSWHSNAVDPCPEYDPEKAQFLIKQAKAEGATITLQALSSYPYMQQTAELLQAMWTEVGFKVNHDNYDGPVLREKRRKREFDAESTGASYRFDPDGWFSRQVLSTAPSTKEGSGFQHEKVDKLIAEARRTGDKKQRIELYAAIDTIVNDELPMLYIHYLTLLEAGVPHLKGYQPAISGAFSARGAGVRTAWLA